MLKAAVAGAAGSATLGFPLVSRAQATTLKMQSSWDAGSIFQEMALQYVDRVNAMSGGSLKIDLLSKGALVKADQLQDACNKGVLDAAHTTTAFWYGKNKAASLFGAGPVFGANAAQLLAWIHYGGGAELYRELIQDILQLNLVGFFCMPMPTRPLGWFAVEVDSAQGIRGVKYRTRGLAAEIMRDMGLKVFQLPDGEVISALERGIIEAFEYHNPTSDRELGAQEVSRHYYLGSYHHAADFFEIIFNRDRFEALSQEHRAILEVAAEAASTANYGMAMDRHSADLQTLVNDGVHVHRTSRSIMVAQLKSWDKVLTELDKDPFFAKVVKSQKEWSHRVGFYDLLNSADYKLAFQHYFPGEIDF